MLLSQARSLAVAILYTLVADVAKYMGLLNYFLVQSIAVNAVQK
jgi:hypothetical protein